MRKLRCNDGFTLVELMIVLSIIAILAVVLVPKVGNMKDSVREQGVYSNMNSVRAYLELKINDRDTSAETEETNLISDFNVEFSEGNLITNPFTNGSTIGGWPNADSDNYSVIFEGWGGNNLSDVASDTNYDNRQADRRGKVIVFIADDGYAVWGHDSNGDALPYQIVK